MPKSMKTNHLKLFPLIPHKRILSLIFSRNFMKLWAKYREKDIPIHHTMYQCHLKRIGIGQKLFVNSLSSDNHHLMFIFYSIQYFFYGIIYLYTIYRNFLSAQYDISPIRKWLSYRIKGLASHHHRFPTSQFSKSLQIFRIIPGQSVVFTYHTIFWHRCYHRNHQVQTKEINHPYIPICKKNSNLYQHYSGHCEKWAKRMTWQSR